jgi:hypothetical protein
MHVCMYGCMYVWMYGCMYGCMDVCMYVCMYVWMYVWMYGCVWTLRSAVTLITLNRSVHCEGQTCLTAVEGSSYELITCKFIYTLLPGNIDPFGIICQI